MQLARANRDATQKLGVFVAELVAEDSVLTALHRRAMDATRSAQAIGLEVGNLDGYPRAGADSVESEAITAPSPRDTSMLNDAEQNSVNTSRAAITAQILTFVTATIRANTVTLTATIQLANRACPMFGDPSAAIVCAALANWLNRQIALGLTAAAPLPQRRSGARPRPRFPG